MSAPVDPRATIGDEALELRAQLGTALFALRALAATAGSVPATTLRTLQSLQTPLHEPFLVLALGEIQAGKSTLLHALFAREFSLVGADKIQVCRYGETAREVVVSSVLSERFLPLPFLRSFHVVDPPGANVLPAAGREMLLAQFAPRAEAILVVFNCVDPWGESPWKLLERFQPRWLKNVVFVIQRADLRGERELQAIADYLRQMAIARFGLAFPLHAVSAKKAWLAKTSGIDKARLWTESGFGPLEKQLSTTLGGGESRREKLRHIVNAARGVLHDLSVTSRQAEVAIAHARGRLAKLRDMLAQLRQGSIGQVPGYLRGVEEMCDRVERAGEELLSARLRPWQTLALAFSQRKAWLDGFQKELAARQGTALAEQVERIAELLEGELRVAWRQLREQLRLGDSVGGGEITDRAAEDEFSFPRERLVTEAARAVAVQGSAETEFGARLEAQLGAAGAFGSREPLFSAYHDGMVRSRARLVNAVGDAVLEVIEKFYQELAGSYGALEIRCQAHAERHGPFLERVKTLEKNFDSIAARLA